VPRKKSKKLKWPIARRRLPWDPFWALVDSSDQDRPVPARLTLYRLLADQYERVFELMEVGLTGDLNAEQIAELSSLAENIVQIQSWIFGPADQRTEEELVEELVASMNTGSPAKWALAVFDRARTGRQGAPPTMARPIALAALDLNLAEPALSWPRIAQRLCQCNKTHHDQVCGNNIRIQTVRLNTFIASL
jgi:hypothetical protein